MCVALSLSLSLSPLPGSEPPTPPHPPLLPPPPHLEHLRLAREPIGQVLQLRHAVRQPHRQLLLQKLGGEQQLALDGVGAKVELRGGGIGGCGSGGSGLGYKRERGGERKGRAGALGEPPLKASAASSSARIPRARPCAVPSAPPPTTAATAGTPPCARARMHARTMYFKLTPVCFFSACAKTSSTVSRGRKSESRVPVATGVAAAAARTAARATLAHVLTADAGRAAMVVGCWR